MSDSSRSIDAACNTFVEGNNRNIAAGLFAIADAIRYAAKELGTGTEYGMGGIEFLGKQVGDGFTEISSAISQASHDHLG